jgi:uncharacterized RmlC-like cupin family protein
MRKAKVVRQNEVDTLTSKKREPPLDARSGINTKTVDNPKLEMHHTIIPPGGRNQRHYHITCDAGMYITKGRLKMFFGPEYEQEEVVVEAGDYVFVPQGVIHGLINLSDTEAAELVGCTGGAASFEEAETVFVEPPWK